MVRDTKKIRSEEISAAKKALKALEEKEVGFTRDEALKELEKDVKEALNKGYTLKEISEVLRQNGVLLPVSFLKQVQTGTRRKRRMKGGDETVLENNFVPDESASSPTSTSGFVKQDLPDDEL